MNRQKDGNLEKPKSMTRPKVWTEAVEEAYRFQLAGYRDELEYKSIKSVAEVGWSSFFTRDLGLCVGEGGVLPTVLRVKSFLQASGGS